MEGGNVQEKGQLVDFLRVWQASIHAVGWSADQMLGVHGLSARVVMDLLGSTLGATQKEAARPRDVSMAEMRVVGCTLGCFELAGVQAEGGRVQDEDEDVDVRRWERTSLGFARSPATSGRLGK